MQDVLGLPESFGRLDVDQQKAMFERRMRYRDFQDSAKLGKLLDRYVAKSSVTEAQAMASGTGISPRWCSRSPGAVTAFTGASASALLSIIYQ
jgi:hypothetical protein